MTTEEPETWIGNVEAVAGYCLRCGNVHTAGDCLRGDR